MIDIMRDRDRKIVRERHKDREREISIKDKRTGNKMSFGLPLKCATF